MKFSELPTGQYESHVTDWGIEEVAALGAKLKAVIQFSIKHEGATIAGRWEGFFENKDGDPNKNTIKTLITCGFSGDDFGDLGSPNALDTSRDLFITIEKDGEYNRIKWVNDPNAPSPIGIKKVIPKTKASLKMKAAFKEMRKSVPQKEEEIPF